MTHGVRSCDIRTLHLMGSVEHNRELVRRLVEIVKWRGKQQLAD